MVDDLHHLLVNAGIAGPYLLVGASWGGMNVRLYASQYPDEITGLVLVDSVHPDVFGRWLAALPEPAPGEDPTLTQTRQDLTGILNDPSWGPEQIDFPTSIEQVRASGSLGDLPLVVLTAARQIELYDALPGELSATFQRIWLEAQADLVRLSSAGRQIIAVNSGHNIANDEPGVVIDAIRSLVTEARAR
jgi:pimeloyl-ACP methyl ester carboxylesterase